MKMPVIVLLPSTPPPASALAPSPCQTDEPVGQEDATPAPVEPEFEEISQEMVQQEETAAVLAPVQLQLEETEQEMVEQEDAPTTSPSLVLPAGKVSCTTYGAVVSKKGIKRHKTTALCLEART